MTDFEYREAKVQDWLNELETKYSKDYSTKLEEKLKKIKDIKDLENIDIDIDISEDLINFHILGKYLAVMELKTDFKKEFAENDDVFSMPFKKAVEEMKKRKPILFKDLETTEKQEKENHFWIKKTTNLNITKDIYTKLIKSLEQGNTSDTFIKDVVSDYKLPKGYLEGVYRTVTTQAQQRGHLEQQLNMIDLGYKYGMFTSVLDGRETHKCHNMNGKILPIKEFIEKGLYPPLHYRCRSSIIQLDDNDLKDMNLKVTKNIEENPNRFSDYRKNESYLELFNKKKEEVKKLVKTITVKEVRELPKTLRVYEEYSKNWIETIGKDYYDDELIEIVNNKLKPIMERGEYSMRFKSQYIENLLKDGRFKNQFETKTSGGSLSPIYRKKATSKLFGVDIKGFKYKEYEKYGYLFSENVTEEWKEQGINSGTKQYGDIIIRFKKENLKNRVTYTLDDSLGNACFGELIAGNIENINQLGISRRTMKNLKDNKNKITSYTTVQELKKILKIRYIELQFHGDLLVEDIKEIYFTGEVPDNVILEKFKNSGVRIYKKNGDDINEI